ncbi:hypothetical protein EH243_18425 [Amphritea opalescens]|uniref:Uncharacterized protein n=1 Tax=Amphritea opalescens TaxID=2490544 RepID=A0A430KLC1_9GAMM|nr:hypothetical protein [Amphritea opalescens]RTE64234.1 hypothetical protein EH243_18425 [Amphritea opalescens]
MSWEVLLGCVVSLLPVLEARKEKEYDRVNETLDALSDAYFSTVTYYAVPTDSPKGTQLELAYKWDRVANLTRQFDQNLSSRFSLKSRFWEEGEAWSPQQRKGARIGLESVRNDALFFLIRKQKKG